MTIQIYQFAKKIIRFFKKQKNIIQIKMVCPLIEIIPTIKARFRKKKISQWLLCQELRFMLNSLFNSIDEGKIDVYPRFNGTKEWDTAAAHIIANEAGCKLIDVISKQELTYNKENIKNNYFIASRMDLNFNL